MTGGRADAVKGWICGALLACAVLALAPPPAGGVLHGLSDEALLVPLAMDAADPRIFAGDTWLAESRAVFSPAYSRLVAAAMGLAGDGGFLAALRWLSFPALTVFLAGCFAVARRTCGPVGACAATAVLAATPFLAEAAWGAEGGWPLAAGGALPRDLVFAAFPWIWLRRERATGMRRAVAPALVLGVLANLHPLTAAHGFGALVLADGVAAAARREVGAWVRDTAVGAVAFAAGAAPYVVQYAGFPRTPGAAPDEVLAWRILGIGTDTLSAWTRRMEPALWCLAADLLWFRGRDDGAMRPLRRLAWWAAALAALSPLAQMAVPGIQTGRLARFATWAAALGVLATWRGAGPVRRAGALACLVCAAGSPLVFLPLTGTPRGGLEWAARRVEVRITDAPTPTPAPTRIPMALRPGGGRDHPRDPSSDPALAAAFLATCEAASKLSQPGDVFLVPPETFGAFRAHARRPAAVTLKEGGAMLSFLGGKGAAWFDEYSREVAVRASGSPDDWARRAGERGARWAILDAPATLPQDWRETAVHGPYRIVRTSVR